MSYKDVQELVERDLSQAEVLQHPIWKAAARDSALLEEYVPKMFAEMKERFDYETNMGVYLDSFDKEPKLRALYVFGLGNGSQLRCRNDLADGDGRLVGVAPEALKLFLEN